MKHESFDPERARLGLVQLMQNMIDFPFPQICRHAVGLDLLSLHAQLFGEDAKTGQLAEALCAGSLGDSRSRTLLAAMRHD